MSGSSDVLQVRARRLVIAENLKRLIGERGIQAKALADQIQVSPQAFSQWSTGALTPSVKRLRQIAGILGASVDELTTPPAPLHEISITKLDLQMAALEVARESSSASDRFVNAGKWSPAPEMHSTTAITMKDNNLEPSIRVGDELFVDLTWSAVSLSGVYLLDVGGFPLFRRCHLVTAGIVHVSDRYVQREMKAVDLTVLGRAIMLLTRL